MREPRLPARARISRRSVVPQPPPLPLSCPQQVRQSLRPSAVLLSFARCSPFLAGYLPLSLALLRQTIGRSAFPILPPSSPLRPRFAQGVRSTRRGSEAVLCWSGGGVPRVHRRRPVMTQESSAGAAVSRRESEVGKQRQPTTTSCRHLR